MTLPIRCISFLAVIALLTLTVSSSLLEAHSGAKGVVKERMEAMKSMGQAMKGLGAMFKGEASYDPTRALDHATTIHDHSPMIVEQFPEGSDHPPSEALPAIWLDGAGFEAAAAVLRSESMKLIAIFENGADEKEALTQLTRVGKACGDCHDRFRKPEDK